MEQIRWGIISTGYIANLFAEGLSVVDDAELKGVGSRSQTTADTFGDTWNIPNRHTDYQSLADDPEVDVIYIGTPHPYHYENTLMCLNAGKHVLVEKPFAMNARQAQEMIDLAREKGLFLMEAMWTRFIPTMVKVREWVAAGEIGDIELVRANLSFMADFDPKSRLFAPELGGGAMLDVGIYPISFAYMLLGQPQTINSTACLGKTGTDDRSSYMFGYEGGTTALLSSAVRLSVPVVAEIIGTKGYIRIEEPWINPRVVTLAKMSDPTNNPSLIYDGNLFDPQTVHVPTVGNGYNYEAIAVGEYLRAGKTESEIMSLDESLAIMKTMDAMRAQWGLVYPME